jgi:hypothetical protein
MVFYLRRSSFLLALSLLVAMIGQANAQVLTGTVIGSVRDESAAILPGVTITLTSPALPAGPRVVVTNEKGEFQIPGLSPGTYTLNVTLAGFATYQEAGLRVAVSGTIERNVTLKVATVAETITVSGQSPMVDARQTGVMANIPEEVIKAVPIQHYAIQDYQRWIPGVSAGDPSGTSQTITVMGSPYSETSQLMDGATTNNPNNGGGYNAGDVEAVEEMQVSTLGASAEYAVAQGAVFNFVLKQGTNAFKGDTVGYWHPDNFVSKPIKLNCNCPSGQTGFTTTAFRDFASHLGGPIIQDRIWFFGGFHVAMRQQANPGVDPTLPRWWYDNQLVGKVTWQISKSLRFRHTFQPERWEEPPLPDRQSPYETVVGNGGWIPTHSSELMATISNSTYIAVRLQGMGMPNQYTRALTDDRVTPQHLDQITGIASKGVLAFGRQSFGRVGPAVKLSRYVQSAHATHDLRGGVQVERAWQHNVSAQPSGVQFLDLAGAPDLASFRDAYVRGAEYWWQSLWGEDVVTLGNKLTLSLGLRYDRMHGFSQDLPQVNNLLEETGNTIKGLGDMFTWQTWSPRLGFNVKLTDDGKTIIRGNYGRAYRAIFLNDFADVHPGLSPITLARFNPTTGGYTTIVSVTDPTANIGAPCANNR